MTENNDFSHIVQLADLKRHKKLVLDLTANDSERAALAKRMDIVELLQLDIHLEIQPTQTEGNIRIDGHIKAKLVQSCGVTSQPVTEKIDDNFVETLTTYPDNLTAEEDITGDDDIPVDLIEGDSFDVGEISAQWLTLLLNPYPRSDAPDYAYNETSRTDEGEPVHTPFDVLGRLKTKENDI